MRPYCESLFMPFVSRRPSTSRRQPDGFRSARGASGLTRAGIRASHGPAPRSRSFYICSGIAVPEETAEPIVDLLNRGVSVVAIAAREDLTAKRSGPEMAPQRLEKIESAPVNGMVPEGSTPQALVHGARGW